jgi:cobyrinic acid a,c-diamide synthase
MKIDRTLEELADAFTARVSLDRVLELARRETGDRPEKSTCLNSDNNQVTFSIPCSKHHLRHRVRLGIARDTAFHFYYPDNLQAFENNGFELAPFSPMADTSLPDGLDALYIGGGYPELAAKTLSENEPMLAAIRSFCHTGRPVYAECGGLMYLCEGIALKDGALHAMVGVLPGVCRMQDKIGALGYAEVLLTKPSLFGEAGTRLRGHAFHYSVFDDSLLNSRGWTSVYNIAFRKGRTSIREGYQKENVLISYVHLHLASQPSAVVYFRDRCVNAAAEIKGELCHG